MNRNMLARIVFSLLLYCISFSALSELQVLDDSRLASISGQLMASPLIEGDLIFINETPSLTDINASSEPFIDTYKYRPLAVSELAQHQGQAIRFIHTAFPTGARTPDTNIGNNGNLNFYGRDYRVGDNFDRASDCFQNACGNGNAWDSDGDGIPGNSGGNANFIPTGDGNKWEPGADGHIDDFYYEYDWYGEHGTNGIANGAVPDSAANWQFYRMETDALIKVVATINRVSMGGYTANYGGCANAYEVTPDDENKVLTNSGKCGGGFSNYSGSEPGLEYQDNQNAYEQNYQNQLLRLLDKDDIENYFNYDTEIRNIAVGAVACSDVSSSRAKFLQGNAGYFGHCEADERTFSPVTLKNPFTEIALAPECELFADPDCSNGGSTDLVFAGYRTGFSSVSGSLSMYQYSSTGSTNANLPGATSITCNAQTLSYGGNLGTSESVCEGYNELLSTFAQNGVLLFGHRSRGMGALPGALCVTGGTLGINVTQCPELGTGGEGLQSNISGQDLQGLWTSVVRNDFQWPGQGWAANDGNTTSPSSYRTTLADRDYAGANAHIPPGAVGHGGTVINNYSPPVLFGIGAAYTHSEIGL